MADAATASAPPARGTHKPREIAGVPWYWWAAGGAALLLGYWYISNGGGLTGLIPGLGTSSTSGTTSSGTTSPTGLSSSQLMLWILDHQQPSAKGSTKSTKSHVSATQNMDVKQLHSTGKYDVQGIAKGHGVTEKQLLQMNPGLRKYAGTGKKVPKGTLVKFP